MKEYRDIQGYTGGMQGVYRGMLGRGWVRISCNSQELAGVAQQMAYNIL